MTSSYKLEKEQKRRLQYFLSDLAILGSLQGFRYFQPWLRGREELLLTIVNEDLGWQSPGFPVSVASSFSSTTAGSSSSSDVCSPLSGVQPTQAPPQQASRYFYKRYYNLSAFELISMRIGGNNEAHLLPASPSEREIAVPEINCTLFLLAGYAKYGRPYAWIRSNHERLVNIGGTDSMVRDTPMKLKSITDWGSKGTRVWDVVSELVCLCTIPPPANPFSLDMRYLQTLPLSERFLVSGALINFLEMLVVQCSQEEQFYSKVVEEVDSLRRLHVQALREVQHLRSEALTVEQGPPEEQ